MSNQRSNRRNRGPSVTVIVRSEDEEYVRYENQRFLTPSTAEVEHQTATQGQPQTTAPFFERMKDAMLHHLAEIQARSKRRPLVERVADEHDHAMILAENDQHAVMLDSDRRILRRILAALDRMEHGEYGFCVDEDCGAQIKPKRLEAVSYAERCIRCQEKADEAEREAVTAGFEDWER